MLVILLVGAALQSLRTGSGAKQANYSLGTGWSVRSGEAAEEKSSLFTYV
jgi:hypothetical protein